MVFYALNCILLGNDSQSEREKEKQPSRPGSAENKPKFMSTRKYFHKDEDFYVMDAKSIGKIYTICAVPQFSGSIK